MPVFLLKRGSEQSLHRQEPAKADRMRRRIQQELADPPVVAFLPHTSARGWENAADAPPHQVGASARWDALPAQRASRLCFCCGLHRHPMQHPPVPIRCSILPSPPDAASSRHHPMQHAPAPFDAASSRPHPLSCAAVHVTVGDLCGEVRPFRPLDRKG